MDWDVIDGWLERAFLCIAWFGAFVLGTWIVTIAYLIFG